MTLGLESLKNVCPNLFVKTKIDVQAIKKQLNTQIETGAFEAEQTLNKNQKLHAKIEETLSQSFKFFVWFSET